MMVLLVGELEGAAEGVVVVGDEEFDVVGAGVKEGVVVVGDEEFDVVGAGAAEGVVVVEAWLLRILSESGEPERPTSDSCNDRRWRTRLALFSALELPCSSSRTVWAAGGGGEAAGGGVSCIA